MGNGLSNTLGKDSLAEENRLYLDAILQRLSGMEYQQPHLDLSNRCLGDEGIRFGSRALKYNRGLASLDLSSNHLTAECIDYLVEAVQENGRIASLNVSGNPELGDAACKALGEFLASNPSLEELSLFHCGVSDVGVEALVNGLMYNTNLAVLRLDMNELSDASLEMLLQLVVSCENKTLGHVTLTGNPGPFAEDALLALKRATAPAREALVAKSQAAKEALEESERLRRQAEEDAARADAAHAAACAAADQEAADLAEAQRAEEEILRRQDEENAQRRATTSKTSARAREARQAREEEERMRTIEAAYKWRDKLTNGGTLVREWRDGFTVMQTNPGEPPGVVPSVLPEPPRRLKACWCDPHDVSAPYAKTLHYHCKYESQNRTMSEDADSSGGKYSGCRASGHCCATVGFFAKPLPDTSAAHFFASSHPTSTI